MLFRMSEITEFFKALVDVLVFNKHKSIPTPRVLLLVADRLTILLKDAFPNGIAHIDLEARSLSLALIATILPPLTWNIIGPFEYYTRAVTRTVQKPIVGVYLSAIIIATLSVYRSALFVVAMHDQPTLKELDTPLVNAAGGMLFVMGVIFFVGAYFQLGISGTYLGDYFGIFREERITAFPFNILNNPMYDGSSMFHFAEAIL